MGSDPGSMVAAALGFAARGWSVLPLRGKKPLTQHGCTDATTKESVIRKWFAKRPNANVGLATGKASRLVVLDVDGAEGGESLRLLESQFGELPLTLEVRTGDGGRHLYFAMPEDGQDVRNSSGSLGPGLDVRGTGGYVVAPPSIHPETHERYSWANTLEPVALPAWLASRMRSARSDNSSSDQAIAEGTRNQTLAKLAGSMRRHGLTEAEICVELLTVNAERCKPPLPEREVQRIAESIGRYPSGIATGKPENRSQPDELSNGAGPVEAQERHDDGWPSPLGDAALHGVLGELVRAVSPQTEADPAALLVQLLAMFGSVIGRTAHWRVEADKHYLNLYLVLVGATGKGRKGTSGGHVRKVFEAVDPEWSHSKVTSGLSSGEGLIWAVRDPIEKQTPIRQGGRVTGYETVVDDPGIADKRLLVVESEFSSTLRVIGRDGNILSALMRQGWDGQDLRTLTKTTPAKASGAHISIIGHITRDELRRDLDRTESANGFGNRFLWTVVRRSKELPDGGCFVDLTSFVSRIRTAVESARLVGEMRRDEAASSLWRRVYGRLSAGRPGLLGAMTGRAEAQVMRLACLYALGDNTDTVGLLHLRAALELWRYCFESSAYIFGERLGDPTADEILRALSAAPNGLTRSELLHDVFRRNRQAAEVARALDVLEQSRLARREEDRSGGGRPAERWFACERDDIDDMDDTAPSTS